MFKFSIPIAFLALVFSSGLTARALERPEVDAEHGPVAPNASRKNIEAINPKDPVDDRQFFAVLESKAQALVKANSTLLNWKDKLEPRTVALKDLGERPAQSAEKLSPAQVFQRAESSVVIIGVLYKCNKCPRMHCATASGLVLTRSGAVATNLHVLKGNAKDGTGVVVMTRDGQVWPVKEILAVDAPNDLLVMQLDLTGVDGKAAELTPIPLGAEVPPGTAVNLVSHPSQHFYYMTTGVVARYSKEKRVKILNVTTDFGKGSSGAPILDERGAAVGVVCSTESISADSSKAGRDTHQTVIHNCAPVEALVKLVTTPYVEPPKKKEESKKESETTKETPATQTTPVESK